MNTQKKNCNSTNSSPVNKLLDGKSGRRVAGQLRNRPRPKKIDKKSTDLEKKHMTFINHTLSEFHNVSRKDIIDSLKNNKEDYGCTLFELLDCVNKKKRVFSTPSPYRVHSNQRPKKRKQFKMICTRQGYGENPKAQRKCNMTR
tara:strand:- start:56 stop:487 length:432 start_codon:yes stop_codon:yes gene_type:complete